MLSGCAYEREIADRRFAAMSVETPEAPPDAAALEEERVPPAMSAALGRPAADAANAGRMELASYSPEEAAATAPARRMLVYNARLGISVADVDSAMKRAEALAAEFEGYVQKASAREVTLRIPAAKFRDAVEKLCALGAVTDKNIEAMDITEEFMDLELRLANARALRKRLEELLKRAETVKETIEVERELNRIREEVERLEGRIRYLSSQIAFSTIIVTWRPIEQRVTRGRRPALPFAWLRELGVEQLIGRP